MSVVVEVAVELVSPLVQHFLVELVMVVVEHLVVLVEFLVLGVVMEVVMVVTKEFLNIKLLYFSTGNLTDHTNTNGSARLIIEYNANKWTAAGGGGGSGYTDGSVTVVSTQLGGSTGEAKVILRIVS